MATTVRGVEYAAYLFIDRFLLAEKCYQHEMNFPTEKSALIQNKFRPLRPIKEACSLSRLPRIRLLYTGTLAPNYGTIEAIKFTKNISTLYPEVELKIIGYAPDPDYYRLVLQEMGNSTNIRLIGGKEPVPHEEIIDAISNADFALLPYQPDKSIENCFPTKIWEYLAHKLPMIIQDHKPWVNYCSRYESCLAINFQNYASRDILDSLLKQKFYTKDLPTPFFWHSEELTLLKVINNL